MAHKHIYFYLFSLYILGYLYKTSPTVLHYNSTWTKNKRNVKKVYEFSYIGERIIHLNVRSFWYFYLWCEIFCESKCYIARTEWIKGFQKWKKDFSVYWIICLIFDLFIRKKLHLYWVRFEMSKIWIYDRHIL